MDAIDSWTSTACTDKYLQAADHQHAITTIASLLHERCDAKEAAASIAGGYLARIKTLEGKLNMTPFWCIICDAARRLGGNQLYAQRLADLVVAISQLDDVQDGQRNDDSPAKNMLGHVYWRGLPDWALTFREYGAYLDGAEDNDTDLVEWKKQAPAYHNAHTFAAILLNRAPAGKTYGMEFYALDALKGALELDAHDRDSEVRAKVVMNMPAAATWMRLAGLQLYAIANQSTDPSVDRTGVRREYLVRLSIERWAIWRENSEKIAQDAELDEATRSHAARALGCMMDVEGTH